MSRRTLRILCFGDSLTSGFPVGKPYAEKLTEKLEEALLGHGYGEIQYVVEGVPGDLVTRGTYLDRMKNSWKNRSEFFDWTIILGGTNDLGWGRPVDDIIASLKQTWDIPLSKGGKVLALTVLDTRARNKDILERRNEINTAIKEYKKPNFFYFDLHNAIPYHDMVPSDRPKYWRMDGLHLTEDGYDLMGEKISTELIKLIRLADAQDTDISSIVTNSRQRRAMEELIFEEERGNPKLLSQGYIVVRKGDLD
ncbi:SGNH hydrolase [Daldinia sp. FL1419]|nr:SGNH hydrolase [Daldinia sp. FL1419]